MQMQRMVEQAAHKAAVRKALQQVRETLIDYRNFNLQRHRYHWLGEAVLSRLPAGARIADIGAAPGHVSLMLKLLGFEVTAFDLFPDADMWEQAPEGGFAKQLQAHGVEIAGWDVEVSDPACAQCDAKWAGAFDAVVFTEVLEHIYQYPFASIKKVSTLLKPGGLFFLTTPNRGYVTNRLRALVGKAIDTELELLGDHFPPHMRHVWLYNRQEVCEMLRAAQVTTCESSVLSFHLWSTKLPDGSVFDGWRPTSIKQLLKLPLALLLAACPDLGSTVCVIGQKT